VASAASGASRCSTGRYPQRLGGASVRCDRFHNAQYFGHAFLLGLDPRAVAIVSVLQFFITLFPHWNVRTPNWVGYFIQRPEEHILHHQREVHGGNYSDWPLWDKVFGTYRAPVEEPVQVGFERAGFAEQLKMLAFIDVNAAGYVNRGRIESTSFRSTQNDYDVI
jgi:Fatty acid hydroxylase superfamily